MIDTSMETTPEEGDLVDLALHDRRAFAPLYARYLDPVHRYCHGRLGTREAAEDATSLVFAKALAALPLYRGGSFRAWLFAIAHRVVIDEYRATRLTAPLADIEGWADPAPTPKEVALAGEERRSVRRMLATLPPEQRQLIELRLVGLNGREIAQILGRSHAWVRTNQARSLARLRSLAEDPGPINGGLDG